MSFTVILISVFLLLGCLYGLVAAIGVVRMPDLYCRMHAATKAGAFGSMLILVALCIASPTPRVLIQSILIILFFYLTAPIAAQLFGRVGLQRDIKPWTAKQDLSKKDTN